MPNYYYVKTGGIADGSTIDSVATDGISDTKLTGAWSSTASEYFNAITSAMAAVNLPEDGDFIVVSDEHTETMSYAHIGDTMGGSTLYIVSVDDSNREDSVEMKNSTGVVNLEGQSAFYNTYMQGIKVSVNHSHGVGLQTGNGTLVLNKCLVDLTGENIAAFNSNQGDCQFIISNSEIRSSNGGNGSGQNSRLARPMGGAKYSFINTEATVSGDGEFDGLIDPGSGQGVLIDLLNCDLSVVPGIYKGDFDSWGGMFIVYIEIQDCILPDSFTLFTDSSGFISVAGRVLISESDIITGKADNYLLLSREGETVSEYNVIRTDGSFMFPEGGFMSLKTITTDKASLSVPHYFDIPVKMADFSAVDTDSIRVFFGSNEELTESDIRVELIYTNTTSNLSKTAVYSSELDVYNLSTTVLDTDSVSTWSNAPTYKQKIDIATISGTKCVPIVRVYIYKPSTTIYIDTEFDLHAG